MDEQAAEREQSAFADWAERHPRLAGALASLLLAAPIAAALKLGGETGGTAAIAFAVGAVTVFAFFEAASWLLGRPVLPALMGRGGDHLAEDGRHGSTGGWSVGGEGGDGGGGGGGDGGGGG